MGTPAQNQNACGQRSVLLSDGEDAQGEPAPQGDHELVHVDEARQYHGRDEGVSAQEQEGVAGIVLVVGRGVVTAGEHGGRSED